MHFFRDSPSDFLSNVSDTSSTSILSIPTRNKGITGQRIKSKDKLQSDLQGTISKVTSLLENKYSSTVSQSASLKPEMEEDVAFCQLILSLLTRMDLYKNTEKKKEILRIIYDL